MVLSPEQEMEQEFQAMMTGNGAPPLDQAMASAEGGDPLELDLLMSGFYGGELGDNVEGTARHEIGLRALGDLIARIRDEAVARRWGVDENTLLNMAFRHGHQYVEVDRGRRAVVERPAPKSAVRRKVNKCEPWYRQQHGRLSGGAPKYTLQPTTRQQVDRDAAGYAKDVASWLQPQLFSHHNRSEIAMWKLLGGTSIYYCGAKWVKDAEYMVDPATGQPVHRPDLDCEVVPPQSWWCDDRIPTINNWGGGPQMRWVGRDRYVAMPEAVATWPEHAQHLIPATVAMNRGHSVLRRVQRLTGIEDPWGESANFAGGALAVDEEEETTVGEFWLRENAVLSASFLDWLEPEMLGADLEIVRSSKDGIAVVRFPNGLRVVLTTDGRVLEAGENIHGYLPFREMRFSKSPGFWAVAPLTPMRELQMAFNWVYSMREAHAIKSGNAPLMQPREARMSRRGGITSAFARIFYRANRWGAKPEYLTPPQMGVDVAQLQAALETAWMDIGGIHEVSQAKLPSADLSGVTISLLQEQDLQQLGYAGEEQEAAYIDILRMTLLTIQKFWPSADPRLVSLAGDAQYKLRAFMQSDLTHGLDLQVLEGSATPASPAAVEAKAREAWQGGWMLDEYGRPDYRRMKAIYGFGSADDLYEEEEVDIQNARTMEDRILALSEQEMMQVGIFVQVAGVLPEGLAPRPEDDPFVHEREHRMRLKRCQNDPRCHPWAVEILRLRWQAVATTIAPLLMQTDPAVALAAGGGAEALSPGPSASGKDFGKTTHALDH